MSVGRSFVHMEKGKEVGGRASYLVSDAEDVAVVGRKGITPGQNRGVDVVPI